jgi:serine/threonine protein kinase
MFDPPRQGALVAERYALGRRINVQGWGSLWLARDQNTLRVCAIRLGDVATRERAELAARYRGELEAATQIRCENVVDIFDQGEWNGIPYLVMERFEGELLAERLLSQRPLDPWTTYRIVAQIACALARAHGVGVLHRDLDPEHIVLVPAGKQEIAKVFDFGITRHENEWTVNRATKIGATPGIPYYASPERAAGFPVDWRGDLWSLGVIAYECLTGQKPFESEALGDLLARILHQPVPEIVCPTLGQSPALERWWQRAVGRERAARFQTAWELADELGTALRLPIIRVPPFRPMFVEESASPSALATSRPPVRQSTRIGLGNSLPPTVTTSGDIDAGLDSVALGDEELPGEDDYQVPSSAPVDWRWVGVACVALLLMVLAFFGIDWMRQGRVVVTGPRERVISASASGPVSAETLSEAAPGVPTLPPPRMDDVRRTNSLPEPGAATPQPVGNREASVLAPPPAVSGVAPAPAVSAEPQIVPEPQAPSSASFPPAPGPMPHRGRDYGI